MIARAAVMVAGARFSEPSGDFPASWFATIVDEEGNAFENVYCKADVFTEPPKPGTMWNVDLNIAKRDGKVKLQIRGASLVK